MSANTGIEWTDATWNPIRGVRGKWSCVKVSPGCANCYAEVMNVRFGGPRYVAGVHDPRLDLDVLTEPLRWRRPRRIFVCSMTDLFQERVRDEWIESVWTTMGRSTQHTFQVLTKRPDRMRRFVEANLGCTLPNVWLGVSVEDQERADERIPLLLQTPAAVRFVSYEPAIGPVNFGEASAWLPPTLDWVIVGGESGSGARPFELAWARETVKQCRAAGVACFIKQLGALPIGSIARDGMPKGTRLALGIGASRDLVEWQLRDRKGGDPSEWPADLRVREFPG